MPNQTLIRLHIFNSVLYAILYASENTIKEISLKNLSDEDIYLDANKMLRVEKLEFYFYVFRNITVVFVMFMDVFLIFLITRFTRKNQTIMMQDTVLGREVPRIVFVNNQ